MKELTLEITSKCYQNCPWCSSSSTPEGVHLGAWKAKRLLKEYRKTCNIVRFSGGEPTLHPDLFILMKYAKKLNYKTVLLTNGLKPVLPNYAYTDEYWIHIVSESSLQTAFRLQGFKPVTLDFKPVTMEVVLVEGNEKWIREALHAGFMSSIPVRLLILQKQGRGVNCKPLNLITWTGNKGCNKNNKVTITHDGKIVTCSALKYGECSLDREV